MNTKYRTRVCSLRAGLWLAPSFGQPTPGTPGSPDATTPIDRRCLPNPLQPFKGQISPTAAQSKPYWPALTAPPKGVPNVLLIMTDDVGFSAGR